MKVERVEKRIASTPLAVIDSCVTLGLAKGGHPAMPDIDVDFASDRRSEIKEYLENRYNIDGLQRVFSAGTFSCMKLKAVIKDVARVHRIPHSITNYITSILDDEQDNWTDLFLLAATNKKINKFIQDYPLVFEDIRGIMGQPRSTSIHASAIIVTPAKKDGEKVECFDFLPIRLMDNLLVSEFDGYAVDEIGLLKEDVLATKELSKLSATVNIVNSVYNKNFTIEHIVQHELKDDATYRTLANGFTQNIFQFSSKGITKFIMDVIPTNIEDLIAINALYRPATLDIKATEEYIRYKHGEVAPVYNYGTYEATCNTFGIMAYQEQFMSIAHTLAKFDLGKTDLLRKAIGKKNASLMASLKEDFISGAISNGCLKDEAEEIWHKIETAGKYSFNRSHAAAYALTAYAGAWLKTNYPVAFYTVALQWVNEKDIPSLMREMECGSNARIVPPDINVSSSEFFTNYETNEIFWSLSKIKMLGSKTVEFIINEREKNGDFTSIENFIHRIFRHKMNRNNVRDDDSEIISRVPVNARHIKHLILAGSFDNLHGVKSNTERWLILNKAAQTVGFQIKEKDFPNDLIDKHYFWSMLQIDVSGIGSIDYERIYANSSIKNQMKGRIAFMNLREALQLENEGKRIATCATVVEIKEFSYKDKSSGENKQFCKISLQQNNEIMELVLWNDFYAANKALTGKIKDKVIIVTAIIRYSDYSGTNNLNTYKSSLLVEI